MNTASGAKPGSGAAARCRPMDRHRRRARRRILRPPKTGRKANRQTGRHEAPGQVAQAPAWMPLPPPSPARPRRHAILRARTCRRSCSRRARCASRRCIRAPISDGTPTAARHSTAAPAPAPRPTSLARVPSRQGGGRPERPRSRPACSDATDDAPRNGRACRGGRNGGTTPGLRHARTTDFGGRCRSRFDMAALRP